MTFNAYRDSKFFIIYKTYLASSFITSITPAAVYSASFIDDASA